MCYQAFIFVCSKGVKARLDLKIEKKENLFSLWFSLYIPFLKKYFIKTCNANKVYNYKSTRLI